MYRHPGLFFGLSVRFTLVVSNLDIPSVLELYQRPRLISDMKRLYHALVIAVWLVNRRPNFSHVYLKDESKDSHLKAVT